ncbi:MAG: hypothetical protein R2854_29880 [Caldilineaceae bacterium]
MTASNQMPRLPMVTSPRIVALGAAKTSAMRGRFAPVLDDQRHGRVFR